MMEQGTLLLRGGGVSGALAVLMFYFEVVVSQLPFFSSLEHVVGPLRAAPSLTVHEAPPASREGTSASTAVVDPGFLAITVVVLEGKQGKVLMKHEQSISVQTYAVFWVFGATVSSLKRPNSPEIMFMKDIITPTEAD